MINDNHVQREATKKIKAKLVQDYSGSIQLTRSSFVLALDHYFIQESRECLRQGSALLRKTGAKHASNLNAAHAVKAFSGSASSRAWSQILRQRKGDGKRLSAADVP